MLWGSSVVVTVLLLSGVVIAARFKRRDLRSRRNILSEKCLYPCTCPTNEICDECVECPRQSGEPCSDDRPCDQLKGLICTYLHDGDTEGICRGIVSSGVPCVVYNRTYQHGETFSPDCRTQCACQNGTYGCSPLCPQEHISPKGTCRHPRLVEVPGQCCREWMCDGQAAEQPPLCQPAFTKWSECSSDCGSGLSRRRSNLNGKCEPAIETRICQTRRCEMEPLPARDGNHHLRRGHECKATHRLTNGIHLRFGPCISRKRYRPKYCGTCTSPGITCQPLLSTTVKVDFFCESPLDAVESPQDLLPDYIEPGEDLWTDDRPSRPDMKLLSISVQWVLKCSCVNLDESNPTASTQGAVILHRVHRTAAP